MIQESASSLQKRVAGPTRSDTRELLLDAAERLFAERGYAGVGVREIVVAAGANLAAVNYHFGSKADLYVATVRRALERSGGDETWDVLSGSDESPEVAAQSLAMFIRGFLLRILDSQKPSAACSLIIGEAAQPSDAINAVIDNFIRPHQQRLAATIAALRPDLDPAERLLCVESIVGQMLHYRVFRPFLEKTNVADFSSRDHLRRISDHIARFTLSGLGFPDALIERALNAASDEPTRPNPTAPQKQPSR